MSPNIQTSTGKTELLDSLDPLSVTIGKDVTVLTSVDVTIRCLATGVPEPIVTWMKHGLIVRSSDRMFSNNSMLILTRGQVSDSAVYTCIANNLKGETSANTNVTFIGEFLLIEISFSEFAQKNRSDYSWNSGKTPRIL